MVVRPVEIVVIAFSIMLVQKQKALITQKRRNVIMIHYNL